MKRTRRVSLTIEHREISLSHGVQERRGAEPDPVPPDELPTPPVCAICGADWVLVDLRGTGIAGSNTQQVFEELLGRGLHPPVYAGGRLWICARSLQHVRDSL